MERICSVCRRSSLEYQISFCSSYGDYLCSKHKNQFRRSGRFTDCDKDNIYCEICGSKYSPSKPIHWCKKAGMYLCGKHRNQFNRLGRFLIKTKRDKNIYEMFEDHAEIIFIGSDGREIGRSCIDVDDVDKCKGHKWYLTELRGNTRYVKSVIHGRAISLHRYVIGAERGSTVDHIDRDGLNNRKMNLRCVTPSENSVNSKIRSNSGYKNIYKKGDKYQVQIIRNYRTVFCKTFTDISDAIKSRDIFISKYNKEHNRIV